jgi:hypothetical protein
MLQHLASALVLVSLPTAAYAQTSAPSAAVCDGSAISHAERAYHVGRTLAVATAAADVVALLTIPRNPEGARTAGRHFGFVAATLPVALTGYVIAGRAAPGETFWENVMARMKVGETRAADVRLCLHRPDALSSNARAERWTYVTARPSGLGGGALRTLRLTFRDSVLADVERTEVNHYADARRHDDASPDVRPDRHRGYCAPPIPVVADPFPTPTDTTFAAAAMARAQADADAASKNAQLQAAYAMCMASDSAR